MKIRKLNIVIFLIVFILTLLIGVLLFTNKGSYSISEQNFTREDLQDMVVSTALSYYYNQRYTDYEQKNMTNSNVPVFGWPTFNVSPESISRSNLMTVNCAVFVSNVYLYSLGYDFSKGYNTYTSRTIEDHQNNYMNLGYEPSTTSISIFTGAYFSEKLNEECSNIKQMDIPSDFPGTGLERKVNYCLSYKDENDDKYYYNGKRYYKVPSGRIYKREKDATKSEDTGIIDTNGEFIYYYHTEGEVGVKPSNNSNNGYYESEDKQNLIKNEISELLQPGDLLIYRKIDTNGNVDGHVMAYVGDKFNDGEKGFIHASGNDFPTNLSDFTGYIGDDNYSVKYDTWENFVTNQLFGTGDKKLYSIAVVRPINTYCNGDSCTISDDNIRNNKIYNDEKLNNTIARNELSSLRIEQYQFKGNTIADIANQYNSVNVGDEISYTLALTNKSNFNYCASSGAISTEENCKRNDESYWQSAANIQKDYNDITITAKIPDGTTYVYESCASNLLYINCAYDENERKLTISNINIPNDSTEYTFNYSVTVDDNNANGSILNEGMTLNYNDYQLKLDEMSILVNNTLNGANIEGFNNKIDNYNEKNSSTLAFIKDIYSEQLGLNLDNYLDYDKIKNAIFTENNTIYYKKTNTEISELSSNDKIINSMLVPSLYGGRLLAGNTNGDRAKLVMKSFIPKELKKRTLEVGDIIIGYNLNTNDNSTDAKAWMFYGYGENNDAIFVSYDNKVIKYGPSAITEENSGWRIFRGMYAYDLFVILRPTRLIGTNFDTSDLSIQVSDDLVLNEDNLVVSNIYAETDIDELLSKIVSSNDLNIKDSNGESITNRQYVATGDTLHVSDGTNEITYTLIVRGDVNSDGKMNIDDAFVLAKYIIDKSSSINANYLSAGDLNNDNVIKMNDVMSLLKSIG